MLLVQGPDSETHCGIFSRPDVREALQHMTMEMSLFFLASISLSLKTEIRLG